MSSILDALKKLEQDKQEKEESERLDIGTLAAERDLFHHKRGHGATVQVSSMVLIGGVLLFAIALVCVSAITALLIVNAAPAQPASTVHVAQVPAASPAETSSTQVAPSAPSPAKSVSIAPVPSSPAVVAVEPASSVVKAVVADSTPESQVLSVPPEPAIAEPQEEILLAEAQAPVMPKPEPVAAQAMKQQSAPKPRPAPVVTAQEPPASATAKAAAPAPEVLLGDVDLNVLPVLSESERVRLGLPPLQVNIVGLPTKRQPRPSALINYEKVYVGEFISNTNARLVDVELRGVGLNVGGQLYFLPK